MLNTVWGKGALLEGVNAFQMEYFFINFFSSKHIVKIFLRSFSNKVVWVNKTSQIKHYHVIVEIICRKFESI